MRKLTLLLAVTCFAANLSFSQQESEIQLSKKDSIVVSSYIVGLGYNIVDDSGDLYRELFNAGDEWNMVSFPSRVSMGRYFKSGIGIEAIGAYNTYKVGTIIDGKVNTVETDYYSIDSRLSFDLNKLIGETAWFDPYVGAGLGYTDADNTSRGTYNAVVGFRTWFSDHWGLDLNTSGKWAIGDKGASDHLQHAAGVVYRFGIEKGLSKKGEEKHAQILALEREKQRIQDSIATANRLQEEAQLAQRLAEEKERERLAARKRDSLTTENSEKSKLEQSIKELGLVYFDLNSSYLNSESRGVLDALAYILRRDKGIVLKVVSHTDSRGTFKYNDWLSQRRVKRTIDYLVSKGIPAWRLTAESKGERSLLNECDDSTYCPEEKHSVNRRSEFLVTKM